MLSPDLFPPRFVNTVQTRKLCPYSHPIVIFSIAKALIHCCIGSLGYSGDSSPSSTRACLTFVLNWEAVLCATQYRRGFSYVLEDDIQFNSQSPSNFRPDTFMSGEIKTTLWCLKTHKTSYDGQSLLLVMKNIIYLLWKRDKQYYYTANSPNRGAALFHHRRSYPAV